jgi:lysozyme
MVMIYSKSGDALTEQFEGCSLTPYKDIRGIWTNGYGNTHNVDPNVTINMSQAVADLMSNIQACVDAINRDVKITLTQGEFDALVDFSFNLGITALEHSTLWTLVNAGRLSEAKAQFPRWDHAGGVEVEGLLKRRLAEQAEFGNVG